MTDMHDQRNTLAAELEARSCPIRARNFAPLAVVIASVAFWAMVAGWALS